jgi:hypothetical protein
MGDAAVDLGSQTKRELVQLENRFGIGVGIDCTHRSSVANTARSNPPCP